MIPLSNWLWRHVILASVLFGLNVLTIIFPRIFYEQWENETNMLVIYIMYLFSTTIFTFVTFSISLNKALNGSFGYDENETLIRKFQTFGGLTVGFSVLLLLIMGCAVRGMLIQWPLFALTTVINMGCCALLSRTYFFEHREIRKYLHAAVMTNSHKGLTISPEEANMCYQLDVELTKIQSLVFPEHLSSTASAIQNVQYYYMMRWLHKLQLLMTANESERLWRTSELYNEIQTQATNLQIDESKADVWKKLAGQLAISLPYNKDLESSTYENLNFEELESVD